MTKIGKWTGVVELERQLADAQRSVVRLTQENERLMEISNELRAERHRHERAAAQAGALSYTCIFVTFLTFYFILWVRFGITSSYPKV